MLMGNEIPNICTSTNSQFSTIIDRYVELKDYIVFVEIKDVKELMIN